MAHEFKDKTLLEEALLIQRIIPQICITEIYSSLETFSECPTRVQRVILMFLDQLQEESLTIVDDNEASSPKICGKRYHDDDNQPSTSEAPLHKRSKVSVVGIDTYKRKNTDTQIDQYTQRFAENQCYKNIHGGELPVDLSLPGQSTASHDELPPLHQLGNGDIVRTHVEGVDNGKKQTYYYSLIEIFPDADKDYVKAICNKSSSDADWLSNTVTSLLENVYPKTCDSSKQEQKQAANQKISEKIEEEQKNIIDETYNTLIAIFPNADPTYIREKSEQVVGDDDAMQKFVRKTLASGIYPTLAEYKEEIEVMKMREKYLKNFKIEEFLEIFPDPIQYFFLEKKTDQRDFELNLLYLNSRFRKICITYLRKCLIKHGNSLTKSFAELDNCQNFRKPMRCGCKVQYSEKDMRSVQFMQEVAFIENREQIERFLDEKEMKRAESFKRAKENNELLECGCCYDNEVLAEDAVTCVEGHIFCKSCLQKYAEIQIRDGKTEFTCLTNCDEEFSLKMLQGVLKPLVFSKMLQRKQIEEVKSATIPGLEVCPFCDFASIPPEEDRIFRCLNPKCMKESCRKCKQISHIPLRCEEVEKPKEVKIRTYIEDKMTEALVRTCWNCGKKFMKVDGCNKVTCTCGARMCYLCRQPVNGYSHFNGEGGTEYHKCPLFSENYELHDMAVEKAARKARNETLAQNPDVQLKYDPTGIVSEKTQPDTPD